MKSIYIDFIAEKLLVKDWQVENCAALFEEGCTIPFISRYRKERTGGLDDEQVASIKHWTEVFSDMEKRKESILATIDSQDKLTPQLRSAIENCVNANELEDLYLPYRPKRRTRATIAKEAGLEPLADKMYEVNVRNLDAEAAKYVGDKVADVEAALAGAGAHVDLLAVLIDKGQIVQEEEFIVSKLGLFENALTDILRRLLTRLELELRALGENSALALINNLDLDIQAVGIGLLAEVIYAVCRLPLRGGNETKRLIHRGKFAHMLGRFRGCGLFRFDCAFRHIVRDLLRDGRSGLHRLSGRDDARPAKAAEQDCHQQHADNTGKLTVVSC